jgi:hypothetical protein
MKQLYSIIFAVLMMLMLPFTLKSQTLTLDIEGLEDLGSSYQYEGWVIANSSPVSTGTFTVDGSGMLSQTVFNVNLNDLINASAFVLTIEPNPDPIPAPSDVHILGGNFMDYDAPLTMGHPAAIGDDFLNIEGNYILATPTNGMNTNELSGIWFLDNGSGTPMQGRARAGDAPGWNS